MTCNFDKDELILKVLDGVATPEEILCYPVDGRGSGE